jgi:hypothetical protein
VFYRVDDDRVLILHVLRVERLVRPGMFGVTTSSPSPPGSTKTRPRRSR